METGSMLAHYRVEEKIGAGGMGEVYRAHDTKLGRDVALKVLPMEFAADADRLVRFRREAKVLASLHHPNIASIFGFEEAGGRLFLVMELVEGDDLSTLIARGALPVDDAVDIARQIAEGLEEAHEKGIVHRDLKPANVKRTPDGKVKVLDFGLARAFAGETLDEGELGSAPTMTAAMTQAGTVLGTAAYMSPEQARGLEVDRRTDIWAFGVILFEMLTGKQLFAGETASDTLADILKTDPDWGTLPGGLPPQVERVLRRCLSKDPRQRLRDIGEARVRLEDPAAESGIFTGAVPVATLPPSRRGLSFLPWVLTSACLVVAVWFGFFGRDGGSGRGTLHVAVPAPEGYVFTVDGSFPGLPVMSPDGRYIAFSGRSAEDNTVRLFVRALAAAKAVALDGTENAQYPFWSPDSEWIGFFDRAEGLKKIRVNGGPAQLVCVAGNAKGGSWSENGDIIFPTDYNTQLMIVAAVGGEPRPLTRLETETGFDSHRHPQFLPGGRRYLYYARGTGGNDSELRLASLGDTTHTVVMNSLAGAEFGSGHLFFMSQGTLIAQPFDPGSGLLKGSPVPVAEDIMVITGASKAAFSVSREGSLIYLNGKANTEGDISWLDRQGHEIGPVGNKAYFDSVVLSPDGHSAVVTVIDAQAGTGDLWILELERDFLSRFTNDPADEAYPVWTPDGSAILFNSDRGGRYAVYRQEIGGAGAAELVFELDSPVLLWDVSPDGRTILYSTPEEGNALDLWSLDLVEGAEPRPLRQTPESDGAARFSPDGRWITYWSEEGGSGQTYLAPWPEMTPISQVSTTTGAWSFWHESGTELVYQEGGGTVQTVQLTMEGRRVRISSPTELFEHAATKLEGQWLDMTADGERFLSVNSVEADPPAVCHVVIDWPARLRQP